MDLLVSCPRGAQLELRGPVSEKGGVRVAGDEPRHSNLSSAVYALVLGARWYFAQDLVRRADGDDAIPGTGAEDERTVISGVPQASQRSIL